MGDYGIRVSIEGQDVKTCNDLDTIVNSKYAFLKGSNNGNGTESYAEAVKTTKTIAHGLGYIPFVNFHVDAYQNGDYHPTPFYDSGGLYEIYYYAYADDTNVYLVFYSDYIGSSTISTDYTYNIFIDKGNLN